MLCNLPTERYRVVGRVAHMDFIEENLRTKHGVNFQDEQERPNNIELEVLADTVYVKVTNALQLFQTQSNIYLYCWRFQCLKEHMIVFISFSTILREAKIIYLILFSDSEVTNLSPVNYWYLVSKILFILIFSQQNTFHLALIKPRQLDRFIMTLFYVHENHYYLVLVDNSFCNTLCSYCYANYARCCCSCMLSVLCLKHDTHLSEAITGIFSLVLFHRATSKCMALRN